MHVCARGLDAGLRGAEVSAPSHSRPLQTRPRSLSGASPPPRSHSLLRPARTRRCWSSGPPPPNPRGPGASEPPAGLGAVKLERPTCLAPVWCPNRPEAREAWSTRASQPRPLRTTEAPLCPHAQASTFLREQTSHRQSHRQTHRHSHEPTQREKSWPLQAPQPEPQHLGEAGARRTGRRPAVRRYRGRNT